MGAQAVRQPGWILTFHSAAFLAPGAALAPPEPGEEEEGAGLALQPQPRRGSDGTVRGHSDPAVPPVPTFRVPTRGSAPAHPARSLSEKEIVGETLPGLGGGPGALRALGILSSPCSDRCVWDKPPEPPGILQELSLPA